MRAAPRVSLLALVAACTRAAPAPDAGLPGDAPVDATAGCVATAMGAVVGAGGASFRVWAPNAERVFVSGDFNGWSETENELAGDVGGTFSGCVPGASAGQGYRFVLHHAGRVLL